MPLSQTIDYTIIFAVAAIGFGPGYACFSRDFPC
jgi:hypothetical protein